MGRFVSDETGVTVSVDDSKDERFASGWTPAKDGKPAAKSTKSDTK